MNFLEARAGFGYMFQNFRADDACKDAGPKRRPDDGCGDVRAKARIDIHRDDPQGLKEFPKRRCSGADVQNRSAKLPEDGPEPAGEQFFADVELEIIQLSQFLKSVMNWFTTSSVLGCETICLKNFGWIVTMSAPAWNASATSPGCRTLPAVISDGMFHSLNTADLPDDLFGLSPSRMR